MGEGWATPLRIPAQGCGHLYISPPSPWLRAAPGAPRPAVRVALEAGERPPEVVSSRGYRQGIGSFDSNLGPRVGLCAGSRPRASRALGAPGLFLPI